MPCPRADVCLRHLKNSPSFVAPHLAAIKPYVGTPPGAEFVRLNAMESAYGFEEWKDEWLEALKQVEVNRYPAPPTQVLDDLRPFFAVPDQAGMLAGNGSDELIQMLFMLCGGRELRVLAPTPTFVMYEHITQVLGGQFIGVPLDADFTLAPAAFAAAIDKHKPNIICLSMPNNPTGNFFAAEAVQKAVASGALTLVDCAYRFFADPPALPALPQHPNLVILYTLSKIGLAGLRFGFLASDPALINELHKVRLPYNINALTQASMHFVLGKMDHFIRSAQRTAAERDRMFAQLQKLPGLRPYPSKTNFILVRCEAKPADAIWAELHAKKILVKQLHGGDPALHQCLRVSMGKPEENALFLDALQACL